MLTNRQKYMTLSKTGKSNLSSEEWNELIALKDAIKYSPHTVSPQKMEKFTELMVRTLEGKESNAPFLNISYEKNKMKTAEHNSAFDEPIELPDPLNPGISDRSKRHHPGTPFEEYCSLNPDAEECRIYDD